MKNDAELRDNMRRLTNGSYLVRSEAGFRRAIKDYFAEHQLKHVSQIDGYPTAYPSIVSFKFLRAWNTPQAVCMHVNAYVQRLKDLLRDLESE